MANDSFSPMGLFQQELKELVYGKFINTVKGTRGFGSNWTHRVRHALEIQAQEKFINTFLHKIDFEGTTSQILENMFYYNGCVGFFYDEDFGPLMLPVKFSSDPNEKDSNIHFNGRWKYAEPVPFNGPGTEYVSEKERKKQQKKTELILAKMGPKRILWDIPVIELESGDVDGWNKAREKAKELMKDSCVLFFDRTPQRSQFIEPRATLNAPFIEGQMENLQMIRTASLNATGVTWVNVSNEAEAQDIMDRFGEYDKYVLSGVRYVPIQALIATQEGATMSSAQLQQYWGNYQSLGNLMDSLIGKANDGLIQKSQYQNQAEQQIDFGANNPVLIDRWLNRVNSWAIVNAVWGYNCSCEIMGNDMSPGEENEIENKSADNGRSQGEEQSGES